MDEGEHSQDTFCCWAARLWHRLLHPVDIPEAAEGWIRAHQISAFKDLGHWVVAANVLNAALLGFTLQDTSSRTDILLWTGLVCTLMGVFAFRLMSGRGQPRPMARSVRAIRGNTRDSALLGVIWGAFPPVFFPALNVAQQDLVAIVVVGMMCGGAFMLSTLPQGAMAFVGSIAAGALAALLLDPTPQHLFLSALLAVYTAVLFTGSRWIHREFVGRLLNERLAREQAEVIGMLLREFEMSSSDWLWSTDRSGRLSSGADRFASLPVEEGESEFLDFASLFEADDGRASLLQRMANFESFADVVVRMSVGADRRWVSLTAKPNFTFGRFHGYHGVAADITAERTAAARIAHLASHDALTGLANRGSLNAALQEVLARDDEHKQEATLLLIDLDRFKVINDALGHGVGDSLLIEVARRLREVVGDKGLCARLGGDEFAVVLTAPDADPVVVARRIVSDVARPQTFGGMRADCSASVGIRRIWVEDFDAEAILRHADLALFEAKAQGPGHIVEFNWSMDVDAQERVQLERELQDALAGDQLRLDYQPLFDVRTGRIAGLEALMRWDHPMRGAISPGRFIDIAERSGLIVSLGEWVIRTALEAAARLAPSIRVAVNVSPLQLRSTNLASVFLQALAATGVDPRRIDVEITESVMLSDSEANLAVLDQLRRIGLNVSLDDFGAGYSSFSYLRRFQFSKLKIDKSFADAMDDGGSTLEIIRAIVSLARALGMKTVIEGIETDDQMTLVRDLGCDEVQGYLMGRPTALSRLLLLEGVAAPAPDAAAAETSAVVEETAAASFRRRLA